jgi:hypothetical protein
VAGSCERGNEFWFHESECDLLATYVTVSFSRKTLLSGVTYEHSGLV